MAALEVSVVLPPVQKLSVPVTVGVAGSALTLTSVAADVAEQLLVLVTVTE